MQRLPEAPPLIELSGIDFIEQEVREFYPQSVMLPSEWAVQKFRLPPEGYGEYGPLTFDGREWQREVMDAFYYYHTVIICMAEQIGKSVGGIDVPWAWFQDQVGGRSLLVYADEDTVRGVFEEKLKHVIEQNLPHLWSGRETDLRQDKIILRTGITRCASCASENAQATFSARFVGCDEVAKWRVNAVGQAAGRTQNYWGGSGIDWRVSIVSSPKKVGDPLYTAIHQPGVLILVRKVPCPHCGNYRELELENIQEVPNAVGKKDHDPYRIRTERAAEYVCPDCGCIIDDSERYGMDKRGVWATKDEVVVAGEIKNPDSLRGVTDKVCFWASRLISRPEKYPFYECLASFFEARNSRDPEAWPGFMNRHLAKFYKPETARMSEAYLRGRVIEYTTTGPIPGGVLVAIGGIDTQDNGWFWAIVGYGRYMETWVLRFGFTPCDMNMSEFKDPEKVRARFAEQYYANPLKYEDGRILPVMLAGMDEGGHREKHVSYICKRHRDIVPMKGAGKDAALVRRSESKHLYLVNTESLSKLVEKDMGSDTWHLPKDVSQEFIDQIQRQYTKEEIDKNGNPKYTWVAGGDDHYRDCLNYAMGIAYVLELPGKLNNEVGIRQIMNTVALKAQQFSQQEGPAPQQHEQRHNPDQPQPNVGTNPYKRPTVPQSPFTQRQRLGTWRR